MPSRHRNWKTRQYIQHIFTPRPFVDQSSARARIKQIIIVANQHWSDPIHKVEDELWQLYSTNWTLQDIYRMYTTWEIATCGDVSNPEHSILLGCLWGQKAGFIYLPYTWLGLYRHLEPAQTNLKEYAVSCDCEWTDHRGIAVSLHLWIHHIQT